MKSISRLSSQCVNSLIQKKIFALLLLSLFGAFLIRDFLFPGFIPTHDGEYHIIRLWQFDQMVKIGVFFPRWAPDLNAGFGVPLFQFFYPLPNYVGEFFHLLGFSFVNSIKLVLASGLIISGLTFYLWMRCFFNKWVAFLGAVFYLLAPYHLVDVFIRGSVGEVWALALIPLVLSFITKLIKGKKGKERKFLFLGAISLVFLLTSHNILGVFFFVFALTYGLILNFYLQKKRLSLVFLTFISGLLLSSFFWLPIIFEKKYVTGLKIINYRDHFVSFFQLLLPSWGSGFSVPGISDKLSFQVGIPHLLVIFTVFWTFLFKKRKNLLLAFLLSSLFLAILLMLEISLPVWQTLSFLAYFQYPWRLLALVILISSFLVGYLVERKEKLLSSLLLLLCLLFYLPYTKAVVYSPREDSFYLENKTWRAGTATLGNTFNTIWFAKGSEDKENRQKIEIVEGEGEIKELSIKPIEYNFLIKAKSSLKLRVKTAYFPGWKVYKNSQEVKIDYNDGLINFPLPKGKHSIIVRFEETTVRKLAKLISLTSAAAILVFFGRKGMKNEYCH